MSALDRAVAELDAKRAKDDAPSKALRDSGVQAAFDGKRILLQKPEEGVYAEAMMIVVGEQGEIDVSGRSLGAIGPGDADARKKELIAEIISHFSL
jgi:hypothetical protein